MTPLIYPGLPTPTSKLFHDLQAMIAVNGGRLRLADMIESEVIKPFSYKYKNYKGLWHNDEIELLRANYHSQPIGKLILIIDRSSYAISNKILRMIHNKELVRKTKRRK